MRVTVLLGAAGTVKLTSLMSNTLPGTRVVGALVPCMVGHDVFHSLLPTCTQVL